MKSADGKIFFDVGTGAECVLCHMPGRYYMGIDYRPDHSFRVPRPHLSKSRVLLVPASASNRCGKAQKGHPFITLGGEVGIVFSDL
ncbi:MAG: hypothetical protein JRJ03_18145 [Deltaproteobacteria bacterium]|nr:hypothetical protein [Deltaproteobacteria bacterium]